MKKSFLLFSVVFSLIYLDAQSQCNPPAVTGVGGLHPAWQELPCATRGVQYDEVINIENFTGVGTVTVDWMRIDSINGLPAGLSHVLRPDSIFASGETGCVDISGVTNAPAGNYKVNLYVCVKLSIIPSAQCNEANALVQQFAAIAPVGTVLPNFDYYVRVIESGSTCDTVNGINILANSISKFQAYPNPFTAQTEITFQSAVAGKYSAKLYDVVGKEVYSSEIEIVNGNNRVVLERGDLNKGAYLYSITNGKENISTRLMIRD